MHAFEVGYVETLLKVKYKGRRFGAAILLVGDTRSGSCGAVAER